MVDGSEPRTLEQFRWLEQNHPEWLGRQAHELLGIITDLEAELTRLRGDNDALLAFRSRVDDAGYFSFPGRDN